MSFSLVRASLVAFVGLSVGALAIYSCAAPTEIHLSIRTDIDCTNIKLWQGVAVYVGAPGDSLETKALTFITHACNPGGDIGTLVVVPSGAKDEEVGLRIVAGLTHGPETCGGDSGYQGCIVARRALRYSPHQDLAIDVTLSRECNSIACDPTSTCDNGACGDFHNVGEPRADAGGPRVRCGGEGVTCPTTGNVCCLTVDVDAGTSTGACMPPSECPAGTSVVLNCDDEIDCVDKTDSVGHPGLCMISDTHQNGNLNPDHVNNASCFSWGVFRSPALSGVGLELCDRRQPCFMGQGQCVDSQAGVNGNVLPGYSWCNVSGLRDQ